MKKRVCIFILSIFFMIGLFPIAAYAATTESQIIEVPTDVMVIENGVYYGISKTWFLNQSPNKETLYFSIKIPSTVTTIARDAFTDEYTSEKNSFGAFSYTYKTGRYKVVNIDFSEATNLVTIGMQVAMDAKSLTGVLDLSNTKVTDIGINAFRGTSLTGVILPTTLKRIGTDDDSETTGGVFAECYDLKFVRVAGGDPNATFELPDGLEFIDDKSFNKCTGLPANTTVIIPASVTKVGSSIFADTPSVTTIFVKTDNAENYHGKAFMAFNYGIGNRITVFNNSAAKNTFTPYYMSSYVTSLTYEFKLYYGDNPDYELKLWGQAVNVSKNEDGSWSVNNDYLIPKVDSNAPAGYEYAWVYNDKLLTETTVLKPNGDELRLESKMVFVDPTAEIIIDDANISVEYGYEQAEFQFTVNGKSGYTSYYGYTYTYQWYEAGEEGQTENGIKIAGADETNYSVPTGKDVGKYYYYLEIMVTNTKKDYTNMIAVPVTLTVLPKTVIVTPDADQSKYTGQDDPDFTYTLSEDITVNGKLERNPGEDAETYSFKIGSLTEDSGNYVLKLSDENIFFTIIQYVAEAIFSSEQPIGENDVYTSEVTILPPTGHSISIDGGLTWSTEPIVLDEYDGDFTYLLRSNLDDETKGAIAYNTRYLKIDIPNSNKKPIDNNTTLEIPKTGDNSNSMYLVITMICSLFALIIFTKKYKSELS